MSATADKIPAHIEEGLREAMRTVKLREEQLRSAALTRSAGEIGTDEFDAFAIRYAAAVREWHVWQAHALQHRTVLAETYRGATFIQL